MNFTSKKQSSENLLLEKNSPLKTITKDFKKVNIMPTTLMEKLHKINFVRNGTTEDERKNFMTMVANMFDDDEDHSGNIPNPNAISVVPEMKSDHPSTPSNKSVRFSIDDSSLTNKSQENLHEWSFEEAASFEVADVPEYHNSFDKVLESIVASTQHLHHPAATSITNNNTSSTITTITTNSTPSYEDILKLSPEYQSHFQFLHEVDEQFHITTTEEPEQLFEKFLLLSTEDLQRLILHQVSTY